MITLNYSNVKDRLSNLSCVYEGTIAFPDIILKTFLEKYNVKTLHRAVGYRIIKNTNEIVRVSLCPIRIKMVGKLL